MEAEIGSVGDETFSSIYPQVDFVNNLPQQDKTGWTDLVEFPLNVMLSIAFSHLAPKSCYVQVKKVKSVLARKLKALTTVNKEK